MILKKMKKVVGSLHATFIIYMFVHLAEFQKINRTSCWSKILYMYPMPCLSLLFLKLVSYEPYLYTMFASLKAD